MGDAPLSRLLTARLIVLDDGGRSVTLNDFTQYQFNNDIFSPCDDFSFTLAVGGRDSQFNARDIKKLLRLIKSDSVVRLELGDDRVLSGTGIIGTVDVRGDYNSGLTIELSGRDAMQVLQDNTVRPGLKIADSTLPEIADRMLARYRGAGIGYRVLSDNSANRNIMSGKRYGEKRFHDYRQDLIRTSGGLVNTREVQQPDTFVHMPVDEAKPHEGEKEWAFLERHARNLGVMLWCTCEGDLFIGRPADGAAPQYRFQRRIAGDGLGNNIISGGKRDSSEGSWTSVTCLGHTSGRGDYKEQVKGVARSSAPARWPRDHVVHDTNAKSTARAQKIALRELGRAGTNRNAVEFTVQGFGQRGKYYVPDTVAEVEDEWSDTKGNYYITARSIRGDRTQGEMTTCKAVPVGTITL